MTTNDPVIDFDGETIRLKTLSVEAVAYLASSDSVLCPSCDSTVPMRSGKCLSCGCDLVELHKRVKRDA